MKNASKKTIYPDITIIGAGSYGTAMAITLSDNGRTVLLWGHNPIHIHKLNTQRCNPTYLPEIHFPKLLYPEASLTKAVSNCKNILIAVPSYVFNEVLTQIKKSKPQRNTRIIIASKGLEPQTGRLLQDVVYDIFGKNTPIAIISGPTFAKEIAIGLPTAIILASSDSVVTHDLQQILHCNKNFKIYNSTDTIGVQIAGAVKNIIAIGAGISDGMRLGANARTALITRGLAEMSRLGLAIGAQSKTFMGLAGIGDLLLTCSDNQSRNRKFGMLLGQGLDKNKAQKIVKQTIEGLYNIKEVHMLSKQHNIYMPITTQIYNILHHKKNIHDAAISLLRDTQKHNLHKTTKFFDN
ncbi:NAD(P)H-dependent glycerol-3-phosphate dehydrogenase [Candidatus Blochmannia ocreatus (nom. nud.)]|uniref:Glycerol-3-phosphate dehydrogenase [NAD(P)+] n=1 Tax=Candidatus Blochmannia ocreatus (nom. nud.) TaxID=251538 RepID=A0ABY4SSW9_9ENTR|nr:NAD(P)H-dependent glycerol-3-phosphate dehydrogenase [Candidatus Blochmannia ocreatus]URJ25070.1 NAD(P)H-dependent glycerol-3-phosphate dehydrogenase [Candidatus Blochmannia ocreatus]